MRRYIFYLQRGNKIAIKCVQNENFPNENLSQMKMQNYMTAYHKYNIVNHHE